MQYIPQCVIEIIPPHASPQHQQHKSARGTQDIFVSGPMSRTEICHLRIRSRNGDKYSILAQDDGYPELSGLLQGTPVGLCQNIIIIRLKYQPSLLGSLNLNIAVGLLPPRWKPSHAHFLAPQHRLTARRDSSWQGKKAQGGCIHALTYFVPDHHFSVLIDEDQGRRRCIVKGFKLLGA